MAWVSPRVYAILSKSEEGKDILEGIADKDQKEVDQEVDAFFGKGGKGYKSNAEYSQAKSDDKAEEERYKSMGDEEPEEEPKGEATDEEISEALADFEWQITDSTTVDDYAKETAEKLGIDKQRVLDLIINGAPDKITPDMKMAKVAGLDGGNDFDDAENQKVFKPTEKTIWDDIEHPLYGIAPSEQNENYLSDAIQEMQKYSRNWDTMPKQDKNNVSPEGKKYLEMKLDRYKKALEYIKKGGK